VSNDGDSPVIKRDLAELERHLKQFILEWKTSSARWMITSFLGAADRLFRDYFNRDLVYDAPLEMTAIERVREFAQAIADARVLEVKGPACFLILASALLKQRPFTESK
jgi:hypothetical protein